MRINKLLCLFVFLLFITCISEAKDKDDRPLTWDMTELLQLKKDIGQSKSALSIIQTADRYCRKKSVAVTDNKKVTFEPNMHYYCSVRSYWWPDSTGGSKYVNKDGQVNPDTKLYDNNKMVEMSYRCLILSKAFYLTGDEKYYDAFIDQLKTWFIRDSTYMIPSFEYAQIIPGHNNNRNIGSSPIEAYLPLTDVMESIRLVGSVKQIDSRTLGALKTWFIEFIDDSEVRYDSISINANNNNSLAYDVLMINMNLFVGKEKRAKEIADRFYEKRILVQINEDGKQPAELQRTKAYFYSIYNLTHIVDFCYIVRLWYPKYYLDHRKRIDLAFDFLKQYADNKEAFPYQQITNWDSCKLLLEKQIKRRDYLQRLN